MQRRHFITLLSGAAVSFPLTAFAQASSKIYRVGLLASGAPFSEKSPIGAALIHDLAQHGYILDKNLTFERRGAEGHADRLPQLVAELVGSGVDLIVTGGYPAAAAAKEGATLPIVSINAGDPVSTGLVASLAHPGGTLTGISDVSAELAPKRLELLKEIAPGLRRVAVLWNADDLGMTMRYRALEAGAKVLSVNAQPLGVREPNDFDAAFGAMQREMPDAVLMVTDSLTILNRKRVFQFVEEHKLPAIYEFSFLVRDGGLMSYGPDDDESFGRVAALVARILKGARPAELPFEQPMLFRFALNVKTAAALGLTIPPAILARADEVIE